MIKNYFKIAFRNLIQKPSFSIINILGLTLGLTLGLLIMLFVWNELSYDKYHEDSEDIYMVSTRMKLPNNEMSLSSTVAPLGPYVKQNYPSVKSYVRFSHPESYILSIGENRFEENIYYADSTIFDVFTIKLIQGDVKTALQNPFNLIVTERKAKKLFGSENPIGKLIEADNGKTFFVSCVIEDWPSNSQIQFDLISSFESLYQLNRPGPPVDSWLGINYPTYFKLNKEYTKAELEAEFVSIIDTHIASHPMFQQIEVEVIFSLIPLHDIHLFSNFNFDNKGVSITSLILYTAIGIFILLIACINFMNLSTARSMNRIREVGIRKVIGGKRSQLIGQFLAESILLSLISLILAITFAEILLPEFNNLVNANLKFSYLENIPLTLSFILLALFTGLIAGSYPAFYLSGFKPISLLRGKLKAGAGNSVFRNILVVFQFVVSILLITATIVVFKQINFVKNKDLGFNSEAVYTVPLRGNYIKTHPDVFVNELEHIPFIEGISLTSNYPGSGGRMITPMKYEGYDNNEDQTTEEYSIDHHYFDLLKMELVEGRNFDPNNAMDKSSAIVNQALIEKAGWKYPLGKEIVTKEVVNGELKDAIVKVIGVVRDFNFQSLHTDIAPLLFRYNEASNAWVLIKLSTTNATETIEQISALYSKLDNSWPFEGYFMSGEIERQYQDEQKQAKIFIYFTILAIFIASMGLFGLASFIAEQRSKEIGIRKVLGSSVEEIVQKLSTNFLRLVLIAAVIAIPVSWYVMSRWLEIFAYKVQLSWWIFVVSTLIAMIIAFSTIFFQSLKAAYSNPVDAIRYE